MANYLNTFFGITSQTVVKVWSALSGSYADVGAAQLVEQSLALIPSTTASSLFLKNLTLSGLLTESNGASLTAGTTRTQAGATALANEVNVVGTATAPATGALLGDGVALLAATAGLSQTVINWTAFPVQVYGNVAPGTDTINGVAAATGVPQAPYSIETYWCGVAGAWVVDSGMGVSLAGYLPTGFDVDQITANATGTQGAATVLLAEYNHISTAANTSAPFSAVKLLAGAKGLEQYVENTTANPIQVFPDSVSGVDSINGLAANASVVVPALSSAIFVCGNGGAWVSNPYYNAVGALPGNINTQLGASTTTAGTARSSGVLVGSPTVVVAGQGNGADTTDDVLATFAIPASFFDIAGRSIVLQCMGKFGATNNNKRVKVWFGTTTQTLGLAVAGGTLIADSGAITANDNATGWQANATVIKYGANGSNTQIAQGDVAAFGASRAVNAPVALTATESGVINITVTGSSYTTGAANDVLGQVLLITGSN